jgi:hypothetical protein
MLNRLRDLMTSVFPALEPRLSELAGIGPAVGHPAVLDGEWLPLARAGSLGVNVC